MPQIKYPAMISAKPMTSPECQASIRIRELQSGRRSWCRTRIRIAQGFTIRWKLASLAVYALCVLSVFFTSTSDEDFSSVARHVLAAFGVAALWAIVVYRLAFWLVPPLIERDVGEIVSMNLH